MRTALKLLGALALLAAVFGLGWCAGEAGIGREAPVSSLDERERDFTERMRNVVLDGRFTLERPERREGGADRYEISSAVKLDNGHWRFTARIPYSGVDVPLPVVVPLLWAGDTPMVSLTDAALPGIGEGFSARVLFYGDRYAGTWDHGEYGGAMYGTISPMTAPGE